MGDRTLSIDNLHEVSDELRTTVLEWYQLGLALGLRSDRLDVIRADNPLRTIDCFTDMLKAWLQNTFPEPTWGDLAEALDSIGMKQLAQRVRVKYCGMEGLVPAAAVQSQRLQGQNQRICGYYKVLCPLLLSIILVSLSLIILLQNQVQISDHEFHDHQSHQLHDSQSSHQPHRCGVPYLLTDVIGRDTDAVNVIKMIDIASTRVRIVSIVGPPGIGKSTLAKYVGHKLVQNNRVVVYYIDMNGVTNVPAMTEKLLTCASVQDQTKEMESEHLLQIWTHATDYNTLLLLDNADGVLQTHKDEFETVIQILIESSPYIKVLITSQKKKQLYVHLGPVYEEVSLNVLSTQDACTVLHNMTSSLTPQQAETIAELTGNMPLALRVIGALLKKLSDNPHTPETIIDKLRKEPFSTFSQTRHINASISVSYEYLDNQLKRFIHFIANFPESFDDAAVTEIMNVYNNEPRTSRSEVSEMLESLIELSLIECNHYRGGNRYNFHSVIRTYIIGNQEDIEVDRMRFSIAFQDYYSQVLVDLSQTLSSDHLITAFTFYDVERHNIEHFLYLFDTLQCSNHTIYCRALNSIQLAESRGLIPFITRSSLDGPINSVLRHINDSQTLPQKCMCDSITYIVEFFQWNNNNIEIVEDVLALLVRYEGDYHVKSLITGVLNSTYSIEDVLTLLVRNEGDYHVKSLLTGVLNSTVTQLQLLFDKNSKLLQQLLQDDFCKPQSCCNNISIGNVYHILGNARESIKFYQLALTHQHLHIIQQFYVKVRLYEIYVKAKHTEKARTILHKLSRLYPAIESVPASDYIGHQYEMREIIRFYHHLNLSRADTLIEKEILAFDQLQVTTGCNIDFYTLNYWMELIGRKTNQRDFNKAAKLGSTVIRVYERHGECQELIHKNAVHLILPPIYYYTAIAMYGSNGSVDYLQRTLDVIKNESEIITYRYYYIMRNQVCLILLSYGHQSCIKQLHLGLTYRHKSVRPILVIVLILVGFLRYRQRFEAVPLFYDKHICFIFTVLFTIVLDSCSHIVPDFLLDLVTLILMSCVTGRNYTCRFFIILYAIVGLALPRLNMLMFLACILYNITCFIISNQIVRFVVFTILYICTFTLGYDMIHYS